MIEESQALDEPQPAAPLIDKAPAVHFFGAVRDDDGSDVSGCLTGDESNGDAGAAHDCAVMDPHATTLCVAVRCVQGSRCLLEIHFWRGPFGSSMECPLWWLWVVWSPTKGYYSDGIPYCHACVILFRCVLILWGEGFVETGCPCNVECPSTIYSNVRFKEVSRPPSAFSWRWVPV